MGTIVTGVSELLLGVAGGLVGSWLLFVRHTVTREEVSEMILKETPLAVEAKLECIREELVGLRADISRLMGRLENRLD